MKCYDYKEDMLTDHFKKFMKWKAFFDFLSYTIDQGSQTRGPPDALVWPANTSKNDKSIKFDQI